MKQPIKLSELSSHLNDIDLFICSSSFEERCFLIPKVVKENGNTKTSLVFYNDNEYEQIITNAQTILDSFGQDKAQKINLNTNQGIQNTIKINEILNKELTAGCKNILLDTTTFTHETLLIIFRLLHFKKDMYKNLYIVYVGAKDYSTNESDLNKKWLSSGVASIRSIIGYPGVMSPARNNHLIVLFGFESDRTKSLIEDLQFDTISLGFGAKESSIGTNHQDLNCTRHSDLMNYYVNANKFELSLIDPFHTKTDIEAQVKKFPSHNTVIAAMNNKISTIGAALVAIDNPKVQLIYAKPIEYNVTGYSKPKDDCYLYEII